MQPFNSMNEKKTCQICQIPETLHVFNLKFHTGEHHSLCSGLISRTTPRYIHLMRTVQRISTEPSCQ